MSRALDAWSRCQAVSIVKPRGDSVGLHRTPRVGFGGADDGLAANLDGIP